MKRIILALDVNDHAYALELVDRFSEEIEVFKVGLELFTSAGPKIVTDIQDRGKKVFLDLKFHDIPNTVTKAALSATRLGVFMFNVHTSSGYAAMKMCADAVAELCAKEGLAKPNVMGVTVLTSIDSDTLKDEFGVQHALRTHVKNLALLAAKAGLDGVIASGHEAAMIRKHCGEKFLIVTPGIRTSWSPPDDQKRTMTPREAIREGADYLVIGRSILNQEDSARAVDLINVEILTAR